MKSPVKPIRQRKSRKATGKWAPLVLELRRRAFGVDQHDQAICTQAEPATALKLSSITVSRWERGIQDPPPAERARLALVAENLGVGQDLVIEFSAGKDQDQILRKTDLRIVGLLRCLFLARESWLAGRAPDELQRLARGVFDLARNVVRDARTSEVVAGRNRLLIDEMTRLLQEISQEELLVTRYLQQIGQEDLFGTRRYTKRSREMKEMGKERRGRKRKHRANAEGSVYRDGAGRWRGALTIGWKGEKPKRKFFVGNTQDAVVDKIQKARHDLRLGILSEAPEKQTLEQYLTSWLSDVAAPRVRPKTLVHYQGLIVKHIVPTIGSVPLVKLSPQHVQMMLTEKLATLSPKTCRHIRTCLRIALGTAVKWNLIQRNAAAE